MPLSPNTPTGAFTSLTIAAINAALLQAGFSSTGNVLYCDPVNGLDTNNGQVPASAGVPGTGPVATLAAGYALLRNGFNDVLILIGNGQASGSARIATFTWSKNAAHLVGICAPSAVSQRARIANATTAGLTMTANFFTVSGNGCLFSNLSWFHGAGASQTGIAADICMTVSGSRNAFINCDFEGMGDLGGVVVSPTDAGSRNLKLTGGENYFGHCNVGLDTVTRTGANASVEFASGCARNYFENCTFPFLSGDGATLGILGTGAACMDRWQLFKNCVFMNCVKSTATTMTALISLTSASPGGMIVMQDCMSVGSTKLGDTNALANTFIYGPVASTAGFLADNPA